MGAVLFATIVGDSTCSCMSGTYALTYKGNGLWDLATTNVECPGVDSALSITLLCVSGTSWALTVLCGGGTYLSGAAPDSATCDPFVLVWNTSAAPVGITCCHDTIQVTITE